MKAIYLLLTCFIGFLTQIQAQNVGIGTNSPSKKLTVNGSVLIDPLNLSLGGLDSAALLFGTNTKVGITSPRAPSALFQNSLIFWTNNQYRVIITNSGFVGINDAAPNYQLDVNGSFRAVGNIISNGSINADGSIVAGSNLVADGNGVMYGNLYVAGYAGIGANPSSFYKLNVNGNLLVQTNLGVDGNARVDGKITNSGKGIMLSNSSTTLRSGFTSGTFSIVLPAAASIDITFNITSFSGTNSNVRVMVSQFKPGTGASNFGGVIFTPYDPIDADPNFGNGSTVKIRMQNVSSSSANLGTNATLYLYNVVTD